MREVCVTGLGVVCAGGEDPVVVWERVQRREPMLAALPFGAGEFPIQQGGVASTFDPKSVVLRRKDLKLMSRDAQLAVGASLLAVRDAGLEVSDADEGLGLFVGVGHEKGEVDDIVPAAAASRHGRQFSVPRFAAEGLGWMNPLASLKTLPNMPLAHVAIRLGARGPNLALASDTRATEVAMEEGMSAVREGRCVRALIGGVDSLVSLAGFSLAWRQNRLGPGRPPGEAAAFLLVESVQSARERGATAYRRDEAPPPPFAPILGETGAAAAALSALLQYASGGRP